jgi:hypothetical protein
LLLILIPLLAVLFPIVKLYPELEAFIAKRALQPHYQTLHRLEHAFFVLSSQGKTACLAHLRALSAAASATQVPSDHYKDRYALLQNIGVVIHRVESA